MPRFQRNYKTDFSSFAEGGEKWILNIREIFWIYPDKIFPVFENIVNSIKTTYVRVRPISSLVLTSVILSLLFLTIHGYLQSGHIYLRKGGELVEGVLGIPPHLNPIYIPEYQVQKDVISLVFDPLFLVNPSGEIIGGLAEKWEFKDSGKLLYIKLRDNVVWHDGELFSTKDVIFTIDLYKNLEGQSSYFDTVQALEAEYISDNELNLKLERPSASLLETINWPVLPEHILSSATIDALEESEFSQKPIGTGKYILDYWHGNKVSMTLNEKYFDKTSSVKRITLRSYPNEKAIINALAANEIDATASISTQTLSLLENSKRFSIEKVSMMKRYWAVYFNFNGPDYLKDKRVRQALSSAINRSNIIEKALGGDALESTGPIPESSWAYNSTAKRYSFNIEEAQKLLGEAGYAIPEGKDALEKDGQILKIELAYIENTTQDAVAKEIASDWRAVGAQVVLSPMEYEEFRDTRLLPRSFETILFGVDTLLDPDHFRLWHSSQISPPGRNFASYKSTYAVIEELNRADELLDKGRSTLSQDERKDIYQKFQSYLLDEVPTAFLYHPSFFYVHSTRIFGIDLGLSNTPEDRFRGVSSWLICSTYRCN